MTDRQSICERQGWQCARCSANTHGVPRSVHHRKLRKQGGKDDAPNLLLLCGSGTTGCHGWVHAHPRESRDRGWLVSAYADPVSVPVWLEHERGWYLLGDDCTVTPWQNSSTELVN